MILELYIDGSCIYNPGPGAWALAIVCQDKLIATQVSHLHSYTTNNMMELKALAYALKIAKIYTQEYSGILITIYSDSSYCVDGYTKWLYGWYKSKKATRKNWLWWLYIYRLNVKLGGQIKTRWIPAHSKIYYNELVDRLAREKAESGAGCR